MIRRHPLLAYIVITILPVLIVVGAVVFFAPTPRDGADNLVYRRPGYNFTNALVPYDPTIIRVSETPAYPPLTLPTPQPGRVFQQYLASSSDYLVWVESVMSQTWPFRNDEILALDLHTNKVTILTNTPGRRNRLYTSGSIVLWTGQRDYEQCPNGSETIVKDIVTSHTLATIDCSYHLYPESVALSGRNVVWLDTTNYNPPYQLEIMNLDNHVVTYITPLTSTTHLDHKVNLNAPYHLHISDEYVIWNQSSNRFSTYTFAFNRKTQEIESLFRSEFRMPGSGGIPHDGPSFGVVGLTGHSLFFTGGDTYSLAGKLSILNLDTKERTQLSFKVELDPQLRGNTLIWRGHNFSVWGIDLNTKDPRPVLLLNATHGQAYPVIAGDWLIWQDEIALGDWRFRAKRLSEAFSGGNP